MNNSQSNWVLLFDQNLSNSTITIGLPSNCSKNDLMVLKPNEITTDQHFLLPTGQLTLPHRFWVLSSVGRCMKELIPTTNPTEVRELFVVFVFVFFLLLFCFSYIFLFDFWVPIEQNRYLNRKDYQSFWLKNHDWNFYSFSFCHFHSSVLFWFYWMTGTVMHNWGEYGFSKLQMMMLQIIKVSNHASVLIMVLLVIELWILHWYRKIVR